MAVKYFAMYDENGVPTGIAQASVASDNLTKYEGAYLSVGFVEVDLDEYERCSDLLESTDDEKILLSWGLWDSLTPQQQMWLKHTSAQHPNSFLSHEEGIKREAYQLRDEGLLTIEFDIRHGRSYTIYATLAGRALAKQNE